MAHLNIIIVSWDLLSPSSANTANRMGTIIAAVAALLIHIELVKWYYEQIIREALLLLRA